jgi:hypothetical protein
MDHPIELTTIGAQVMNFKKFEEKLLLLTI